MRRILQSFEHLFQAFQGWVSVFRSESALRQELLMFIIAVPVALSLPLGTPPKAALISAMFLVLMAEIANTAIKAIAGQSDDLMLKKAKNAGSVLVFVAILNAVTTWALIIYPIIIKI